MRFSAAAVALCGFPRRSILALDIRTLRGFNELPRDKGVCFRAVKQKSEKYRGSCKYFLNWIKKAAKHFFLVD